VRQPATDYAHRHISSGRSGRRTGLAWPLPIVLMLALVVAALPMHAFASPGQPGTSGTSRSIAPPSVSAAAVFSFDLTSGVTLYTKDPDTRMQIGSTVKVMTALVVMKHGDLKDEVGIVESDIVDETQYSNMKLQAGDTLTVSTLLYGMLLPSGNDGANALARHVGSKLSGSTDPVEATTAFVAEMNASAASLNLADSRFINPSGVDNDSSYSTAHDLAIMFGELIKNETLARIVAEPAYAFYSVGPENRQYQGDSTNRLLKQNGVIGGKTGSTGEAGGCVVLARSIEGSGALVITAILGSDLAYDENNMITIDVRWDDAAEVFDAMDSQFAWAAPGADGTFPGLAEELGVWGVQFRDAPPIPVPTGADEPATYQLVLAAPASATDPAGTVVFFYGDSEVGRLPVYQIATAGSPPVAPGLADTRLAA